MLHMSLDLGFTPPRAAKSLCEVIAMKNPSRIAILTCFFLLPACALSQTVKEVFAYPASAPGPVSTPAQGRDGSLYTTASGFGTANTKGAIFKTSLGAKSSRIVHAFGGSDGAIPLSGPMLD